MRLFATTLLLIAWAGAMLCPPAGAAGAEDYVLDLVSGPDVGPCPPGAQWDCQVEQFDDASADGRHALFLTGAQLVPEDDDDVSDLYEWSDGTLTRVAQRPTGVSQISEDGARVLFETGEALVPEDMDATTDLYMRENGTVRLISAPAGGSSYPFGDAVRFSITPDASHVYFASLEPFVPEDVDTYYDIYERTGNTLRLVSTGPADPGVNGDHVHFPGTPTDDGSCVFFSTGLKLVAEDQSGEDIYRRCDAETTLISTGPQEPNDGQVGLYRWQVSGDGARVAFVTGESLVPEDTDGRIDLYLREAGATTLISQPTGASGLFRSYLRGMSHDGSRIFFSTNDRYAQADTNSGYDLYEWHDGQITLLSVGPNGAAGDIGELRPVSFSEDGLHVYFVSGTPLTPDDQNGAFWPDVYERAGGTTTRLSVGAGEGVTCCAHEGSIRAIPDGSGVVYTTDYKLVPEDQNGTQGRDLYKLTPAGPTLLSIGPSGQSSIGPNFVSDDGSRVFYVTHVVQVPHDTDTTYDLYLARRATTTGYPRPKGATPMTISLVPAFQACTAPNRTHGAPLSFGSCAPPAQVSSQLTVGTPDANGNPVNANSWATVQATAQDARFRIHVNDVRRSSDLADYTGELAPRVGVRVTDRDGGIPSTTDFTFSFAVPCATTAAAGAGSDCDLTTTANSVTPGLVQPTQRTIWALDRLEVYDGGPDGDADTAGDNTLFQTQGVFVP